MPYDGTAHGAPLLVQRLMGKVVRGVGEPGMFKRIQITRRTSDKANMPRVLQV